LLFVVFKRYSKLNLHVFCITIGHDILNTVLTFKSNLKCLVCCLRACLQKNNVVYWQNTGNKCGFVYSAVWRHNLLTPWLLLKKHVHHNINYI